MFELGAKKVVSGVVVYMYMAESVVDDHLTEDGLQPYLSVHLAAAAFVGQQWPAIAP